MSRSAVAALITASAVLVVVIVVVWTTGRDEPGGAPAESPTLSASTEPGDTSSTIHTAAVPSSSTRARARATTVAAFPRALDAELTHGAKVFRVYLSVEYAEKAPGPATEWAVEAARAVGYNVSGGTDVNCDQGASEQLGLDPVRRYEHRTTRYFGPCDSRADWSRDCQVAPGSAGQ